MSGWQHPTYTQRVAIIGRTGSGKTQKAAWLLSEAPFHHQPYIIVDYKKDELLNAIDKVREIGIGETPRHPGLYIAHPLPDAMEEVNQWLWKIWAREKTGLYFDEMYNVPDPMKKSALRAIFTQGRSKRIPVIGLTQRPAFVSRFLFSEADYFSVFHLNTKGDIQRVSEFVPGDVGKPLPEYHSRWYDVNRNASFLIKPVPDAERILERFDERLKVPRKIL